MTDRDYDHGFAMILVIKQMRKLISTTGLTTFLRCKKGPGIVSKVREGRLKFEVIYWIGAGQMMATNWGVKAILLHSCNL